MDTTNMNPNVDATVLDELRRMIDDASVRTVFAAPIVKQDLTVVPVAKVSCFAGGGNGNGSAAAGETGSGIGAGLAMSAKPVGALVIRHDKVRWQPTIDVNKVVLGGQIVAIVALFTVRALLRSRGRQRIAE